MRLFLVPITKGRALIYCKRVRAEVTKRSSIIDKITNKASQTWAKWEEADKGWKKSLVVYGHRVLQSISYQEWGLKSVPPLSARIEAEKQHAPTPVNLLYPANVIPEPNVLGLLRKLATQRQELHRRRMWWSIIVAPFTAPIALIPLIPNIPFFYLVYRAWSHWRALNGSKHLEFLLDNGLIKPRSIPDLELLYTKHSASGGGRIQSDTGKDEKPSPETASQDEPSDCKTLLDESDGKILAKILEVPELAAEVERAVVQVKRMLKERKSV